MARDGSGNYSIPNTFTPNTTIASAAVNANFSDIATALTNSLARNGEGPMTAVLPLHQNGFNFEVDPDTGIKRSGANEVAIFTEGSNRIVVGTATVSIGIAVNLTAAFVSNTFGTFGNTITATNSGTNFTAFMGISTDAGASSGPYATLFRDSASPAALDFLSQINFLGRDSGGNQTNYAYILCQIADPTNGSEDGTLYFQTLVGGADTTIMKFEGAQVQIPGSLAVTGAMSCGAATVTTLNGVTPKPMSTTTLRDQVTSGTASQGALTGGTWNTRRLQTKPTDDMSITLSSNQFTLAAGTYYLEGWAAVRLNVDGGAGGIAQVQAQLRLRNVTDGSTVFTGNSVDNRFDTGGSGLLDLTYPNQIRGVFTIAGSKTFELQHWVNNTSGAVSLTAGQPVSSGENEVYADLIIQKLA